MISVREPHVGLAAGAVVVVEQDRLAVRGRLGDPDVARNHGLVDLRAEERAHLARHLLRQRRARIVHGQHHALDLECRIERRLDLVDGRFQLRNAFQREELALHRHQHRVRRHHRIQREQIERRRTVDQKIAVRHLGRASRAARRSAPRRHRADGTGGWPPPSSPIPGRRGRRWPARCSGWAPASSRWRLGDRRLAGTARRSW